MAEDRRGWLNDLRCAHVKLSGLDAVPPEYYPLSDILQMPEFKMSLPEIKKMRRETFKRVRDKLGLMYVSEFATYWNNNVQDFDSNLNRFARVLKLMPIAHRIKAFYVSGELKSAKNRNAKAKIISWGINRKEFDTFRRTGKVEENATKYKTTTDIGNVDKYENLKFISQGEYNAQVTVKKSPELERWKAWCRANGFKIQTALMDAIKKQMRDNPVEGLPSCEEYLLDPDVYNYVYESRTKKEFQRIHVNMDIPVYNELRTMITKYNRWAKLNGQETWTQKDYIQRAILSFDRALAKKFYNTSPEYQSLKNDIEYYNKYQQMQGKGGDD